MTTSSRPTTADLSPALLDDGPVGWRFKGLPPDASEHTLAELGARGGRLFDAGFSWPALVLREDALRTNARAMARFTAKVGVSLAPHLKTTMSPELASYAMAEGAWGVTVATPFQARVFMAAGYQRIMLANELVDRDFAAAAVQWLDGNPDREFFCYVDSVAGVDVLADALAGTRAVRPLPVLAEAGHHGGRSGCRDSASLRDVVDAVGRTDTLALAGVSGYEGSVSHSRGQAGLDAVREYLRWMRQATETVLPQCDSRLSECLVSAGGSIYFDLVADELVGGWPGEAAVRVVTRSGAYLTHDQGLYHEVSPLDGASVEGTAERLAPGIEVWTSVLSRPEPGLAIVGAGRRDLNFDQRLPVPVQARDHRGNTARPATGWRVTELNDQHAFLSLPPEVELGPSDLVCFGISHPCTAHDRWLTAIVVDGDDMVRSVARCYF